MSTSEWRKASRERIYETLLECEAQALCLGDRPLSASTILKTISDRYPFGPRKYHPYKQWLKEVAIAKQFLKTTLSAHEYPAFAERCDRAMRGYRPVGGRIAKPAEGQMSLLGGES